MRIGSDEELLEMSETDWILANYCPHSPKCQSLCDESLEKYSWAIIFGGKEKVDA